MAKTSCKKGQYYCNTDKKCKPIPRGFTVREDGFLVREGWSSKYKKSIDCDNPKGFSQKAHCDGKKKKGIEEESNPRIPRQKGQPAKSKKHSDLYTDEDPKGTIHGLGFKDVATAKASVAKIRKSSRSHAHKIQAAIAMEQRARVMGKTAEAAIFRKYINSMKKKTKAMNEEKKGDHEYEMIRRQTDNIMVAAKRIKKKVDNGEGDVKAWVQSKITKAADYLDTAADYMTDKEEVKEGSLHKWFKGSKSKDGKGGWVNVLTGGTCASDEPGEGVPKCVSRAKYERMTPAERRSAARRKKAADPGQQEKTGAAKPTYVSTDKPKKKKKKKKKMKKESTEFTSLPLVLEVPQNAGEFKCGLMFRESLELNRGMLFIFESNDYHTFHMKNTFIPLDIAFIKEDGTIDSIKELDPMSPIPVYPNSEIRYAVEANRGWFEANDVNVGDALLEEAEELNEVKDKKGKGSGKKDACYYKVKSRYSVWPSAYASGALVKCRKVGAANWGNKSEGYIPEEKEKTADDYKKSMSDKDYKNLKKNILQGGTTQDQQNQFALETSRRSTNTGTGEFSINYNTDQRNSRGSIVGHNKNIKKKTLNNHYSWRDSLIEHHKKDADGNTIPHEGGDVKEQYNGKLSPAQIRFKEREKRGLDGLTGAKPGEKVLTGKEKAQAMAKDNIQKFGGTASAAQANKEAMRAKAAENTANKTQSGGGQQQQQQGGQQQANKKPGFLQRIKNRVGQVRQAVSDTVAGAKRVAGGVADAATGNRFDFDKRGGQKTLMGKPINNQGGGQQQQQQQRRPVNNQQQQQQQRPVNNQQQQQRGGGGTGSLTSSAGSLQQNKQKANRIANAANKGGGNVSVGKINFGGF